MLICCNSYNLTNSDKIQIASAIILVITAVILYYTLKAIQASNEENARLNRLQAAENTIIKQIEFHNNLLKGIIVSGEEVEKKGTKPFVGQNAFIIFYGILKKNYVIMPGNRYKNSNDMEAEENRIKDAYTALYNSHGSKLGNYFKNLYLLITYINDVNIKDFNKEYYIDLVKSQLSKFEILLLAYNCVWIQRKPKPIGKNFIEFAKTYNLLSALETDELIRSVSSVQHKDIFKNKYGIDFANPIEFTN